MRLKRFLIFKTSKVHLLKITVQMIYATECLKESFLNDTIVMKY